MKFIFILNRVMLLNWMSILFSAVLASIDAIALPILKGVKVAGWPRWLLVIPVGIYALNPIFFFEAMGYESLTIMNLMWDLFSVVIVTLIGLFYFKEVIPTTKKVGIALSILSLFLMSYEGDGWSYFAGWRLYGGGKE